MWRPEPVTPITEVTSWSNELPRQAPTCWKNICLTPLNMNCLHCCTMPAMLKHQHVDKCHLALPHSNSAPEGVLRPSQINQWQHPGKQRVHTFEELEAKAKGGSERHCSIRRGYSLVVVATGLRESCASKETLNRNMRSPGAYNLPAAQRQRSVRDS